MEVRPATMSSKTPTTLVPSDWAALSATSAITAVMMAYSTIADPSSSRCSACIHCRTCFPISHLLRDPRPRLPPQAEQFGRGRVEQHHQENRKDEERDGQQHAHGGLAAFFAHPRPPAL